jgi:hypothetical protein
VTPRRVAAGARASFSERSGKMRSFGLALRPFAIALAVIVLSEGVCGFVLRPGIVERTKFNLLNRFHSTAVFGKLGEFADSSPDVVQLGDSSGFHGVNPDTVTRYLGGLKYLNLSCCAALGYRGYYGIADFMLRRNPGIKAVVLYVSLRNLPRADLIEGQHQLGEFIENALTTPFAYLSPPTVALRQRIVDVMDRKGQAKIDAIFTDELRQSAREHNGWWPEHDRRLAGEKHVEYWRQTCGASGVAVQNDGETFYGNDKQSYMLSEFQRFASLTARHGAKFVLMFHPYSCRGLEGSLLDARRQDIRALVKQNPNMVVFPERMLELWPTEKFVSSDHLRVGYDEENFRRVGKLLAGVFGIAARPDASDDAAPTEALRRDVLPVVSDWTREGAVVLPDDGPSATHRLVESAQPGGHRVETRLTGLTPGRTLVLSFPAKAIGGRGIFVEVQTVGRRGGGYCDLYGATAQRDGEMLDAGLDPQPDGGWRCWVAMPIDAPDATLRLSLINARLDPAYAGDGTSGAVVGAVELRETPRFLAQEKSPW